MGFNKANCEGSRKFNQQIGYFFENVLDTSLFYNKIERGICDGKNKDYYFECKNRYNTMKQSEASSEINKKLNYAVENNKLFILLIINDKNAQSRNIPLHKGYGMKGVYNNPHYNKDKHKWISGDEIFKLFFPRYWKEIDNYILRLLKYSKRS